VHKTLDAHQRPNVWLSCLFYGGRDNLKHMLGSV